ncbi:MAG: polysaccharide biosynthesis/export family protein [Alphaproteobacteria bacterium]|nr:polysaccharide biosynthesis/export family protein [Alphaproteobacteria bacterium]
MRNRTITLASSPWLETLTFRFIFAIAASSFLLTSCDSVPSGGPRPDSFNQARWQYVGPADDKTGASALPFVLVNVDGKVMDTLSTAEDANYFKGAFVDNKPPAPMAIGVGDTLRITIFEAGPGGLFIPSSGTISDGNYITLPDQEVDQTGRISVPYAGKDGDNGLIKVYGRHVAEVQHDIQTRLMNKAIEPQVIVTIIKRTSNLYSVMGDVNSPNRFSLDQGGVRILDALSNAGGPRNNDYNTLITLQRGKSSATARLSTLLLQPENNIFVQPNDLIAAKKDERYYNVLGATNNNSRFAFEAETVSVADAVSKAGGLNSELAEPNTVVLLRRENVDTLTSMGIKLDGYKSGEPLPTVYRFNFGEPTGLFLAQKIQLRNDDVVYVSNSNFSDFSKLLGVVRDILLIRLIDTND